MKRNFTKGWAMIAWSGAVGSFLCSFLCSLLGGGDGAAAAQHACDDLGEAGWRTVASVETVAQAEGKPYRVGTTESWYIDRTTTLLPMCNYYNAVGNYSLRSYSLSPEQKTERLEICRADSSGVSVAVSPYAGRCPPG